ncbi:MAG: fluoride efflux transporter CrcB [Kiloniellales bacterium]|nr:fluoride efflux transporter CrcB [Kiloniellales bacterium]
MKVVLAIAFGGAFGAVARHYVSHYANGLLSGFLWHGFPYGTLSVNILGSFVIGVLIESMALLWAPSAEVRAFMTVGFLGAFTTFSTFSFEAVLLYQRGELMQMALYLLLSVGLCILGTIAGLSLVRAVAT